MLFRIVLISLLLVGCSPSKRLSRLIRKHPELVKVDTITRIDTTIIEAVKHDTTISYKAIFKHDTIEIEKEKLLIRLINRGDSLGVEGECRQDTIYKEVVSYINKVVPAKRNPVHTYFILLILLIIVILLYKLVRN